MELGFKEINKRLEELDKKLKRHADNISYPEWFMMPTNEGARFLLATLLLALASFNTGNNLIYLICGLMLSIIILSYFLATINTRGLRLKVKVPVPVFASRESEILIKVKNDKKLASYSIRIRLPDDFPSHAYIPYIEGRGTSTARVRIKPESRGLLGYGNFIVESGFPFIFFKRRSKVHVDGSLTVYPSIMDVSLEVLGGYRGEGYYTQRPGDGDELLSLRAFREGDSQKSIHWKASAKSGGLLVKEYAELMPRTALILIDGSGPPSPPLFETAVSWAASAAIKLNEAGYYIGIAAPGIDIPYGSGRGHLFRILDHLAIVDENAETLPPVTGQKGALILIRKSGTHGESGLIIEPDLVVYADSL